MKKVFLSFSALVAVGQLTYAAMKNSDYDKRHQRSLIEAVRKQCGVPVENATVTQSVTHLVPVDQGIHDTLYVTTFQFLVPIDQGVFDLVEARTESYYRDHYDHQSKDWGVYEVTSVTCKTL